LQQEIREINENHGDLVENLEGSLTDLSKALQELRSLANPPNVVKLVADAVLWSIGETPEDWKKFQKLCANPRELAK
jgi:hypothetical protein